MMLSCNLCFSTLKILATVKLITKNLVSEKCFSTLKILATVKHTLADLIAAVVLVPLRF